MIGRRVRVANLDEPAERDALDQALTHFISSDQALADALPSIEPPRVLSAWSVGVEEK